MTGGYRLLIASLLDLRKRKSCNSNVALCGCVKDCDLEELLWHYILSQPNTGLTLAAWR